MAIFVWVSIYNVELSVIIDCSHLLIGHWSVVTGEKSTSSSSFSETQSSLRSLITSSDMISSPRRSTAVIPPSPVHQDVLAAPHLPVELLFVLHPHILRERVLLGVLLVEDHLGDFRDDAAQSRVLHRVLLSHTQSRSLRITETHRQSLYRLNKVVDRDDGHCLRPATKWQSHTDIFTATTTNESKCDKNMKRQNGRVLLGEIPENR